MTPDGKYIIAIDFDGTIIKENKWPDVNGEADKWLIENMKRERRHGNKVILNTCRTGEHLEEAIKFCKSYGLEFDAVNENLPEIIEAYGSDTRKISADIYIDDHACHPDYGNWRFLYEFGMSITEDFKYRKGDKK